MKKGLRELTPVMVMGWSAVLMGPAAAQGRLDVDDLARLSIEELAQVQVTSVALAEQPLSEASASLYVITNEDILRSGATSIPEVLRLAPNLQVARDDAIDWSITARGSGNFGSANKLLVLVDGRSVYHPAFSGVFWDSQPMMLEDIERIEVISGPGGTLYGANAVNGVINITTRDAFETQGWLASATLGDVDSTMALRWGGAIGSSSALRVFATGYQRGPIFTSTGMESEDAWEGVQGGFRFDWRGAADTLTLQADGHVNTYDIGQRDTNANVIARWRRQLSEATVLETQFYWDQVDRDSPTASDVFNAYDVRTQLNTSVGAHTIVAGAGYRSTEDVFNPEILFALAPPRRRVQFANVFVQDAIALSDRATLTLGLKLEHDTFTQTLQALPNIRLAWQAAPDQLFWGAVSRAVRSPNRFDRDLDFPPIFVRNEDFQSEELLAYELGYRGVVAPGVSLSATAFYHDYDKLRTIGFSAGPELQYRNDIEGERWGLEAWARADLTDWWRLGVGGYLMDDFFRLRPGAVDFSGGLSPGADANHQISVSSQFTLGPRTELDIRLRHVGSIDESPAVGVPAYTEMDARLGWRLREEVELYVAGQNLLDESHPENRQSGDPGFEARRQVHVGIRLRY